MFKGVDRAAAFIDWHHTVLKLERSPTKIIRCPRFYFGGHNC